LIATQKGSWQMMRHGDELHNLIIEGIIEGTRSRPRTKYISQIMKNAGFFTGKNGEGIC